ncbi:hypothetical protein [Bacillus phage vB_BceM_Bc431v3]|uniref:Uncharacterized protein n=1 Tax=Bacillus phage vB_BceM_Bc431v3 TaxID=1195072 RepID=M4HNE0_9CAUD|nr:hypothetical protein K201_gp036 [Bacillus phage vB_BceM_Bc431v3]AFQ96344.1 hypothetical protein [Bacillus phage vB_BceM_Bc431v3]
MASLIIARLMSLFEHTCCFCDKEYDKVNEDGSRTIIMACNKCGKTEMRTIEKREES